MDEQQNDERPEETSPDAGQAAEAAGQDEAKSEDRGQAAEGAPGKPPTGTGAAAEPPPLPPELQSANASKDERTYAMLCHLLALAGIVFPFGNILGPLIMWLVKRESSPFVDFHGRQSLWFQVWAAIIVTVLGVISIPLFYVCIGVLTMLLAMGVGIAAVVYAIVGAVQVSGGKDFEYMWVGPWVRRSMS